MGRTKRLTTEQRHPDATAVEEVVPVSLYWFGMLPAQGTFKLKKPTREKDPQTNDYFTYVNVTTQELWEGDVNQWVGRCPWKQSLSVNGLSFDAFTETLMRQVGASAGADGLNKISWPGAVAELDEERFRHVISECYRNVIRIKDGVGKEIHVSQPKSYQMLPNGEERYVPEGFNPRTDTFFAHYVYIVKLEADPTEYDSSTYYRLAAAWNEFFNQPPKSVAEMYPLKDGKIQFSKGSEEA